MYEKMYKNFFLILHELFTVFSSHSLITDIVSRAWESPTEDFEGSDGSSSNSPQNSFTRSEKTSNTFCATNMAKYLNLTNPSNPFQLDSDDYLVIILVTNLLTSDNYPT